MVFNYSYNLTALVFLLVLTIYYHATPIFPNQANRLFSITLVEGTFSIVLDLLTFYCINNNVNIYINYIVNILFFLTQWIIPYLLLRYLIVLTKQELLIKPITKFLPIIIVVINYSLLLSTPFTSYIFYFDQNINYFHGPLFSFAITGELMLLIWGACYAIVKRKHLSRSQIIIVPFFIIISIVATIIQINMPSISISSASVGLAIFLMYLTLLKPTAYMDTMTNVYNRMAFNEYIHTLITKKIPFNFIAIDNVNTTKINTILSENFGNIVLQNVAAKLILIKNKTLVFRLEGDRFIFILKKKEHQTEILDKLASIFPTNMTNNDITIKVDIHISYSDTLDDIESTSEIIDLINFISKKAKLAKKPSRLDLESIEEYRYNVARNEAIVEAIVNEEIEFVLQSILNTKSNQFNTAEALSRINPKPFGYISPSVFIPFAEKRGLITQITFTLLKKVCGFLHSNTLPSTFESISINLSVIDCLDSSFPKKVLEISNQYNIDPSQISFEVTESIASIAPQLEETMKVLTKEGFLFSLDDFGTGFANLDSVLRLPFSTAKIDKTLLNLAQESKKYKVMISSLVDMIKKLNLDIIVEGIETKDQIMFLSNLDVDYLQGYYYSKPLTPEKFIDYINEKTNSLL